MIIIRLDRVLADRKMRLNDLAAQVGISNVNLSLPENRQGAGRPLQHPGRHLQGAALPTGGHPGICGGGAVKPAARLALRHRLLPTLSPVARGGKRGPFFVPQSHGHPGSPMLY